MLVSVDGQSYYAESVDISESISIEEFSALGTKNANYFPTNKPEGSVNIGFYVTSGSEISSIESQYAETGFVQVSAGPFTMNKALLNSFSVEGDGTNIIKGSLTYNYYGQMKKASTPSQGTATIVPAHGAASDGSLAEFGANQLLNFSYNFSQSFDVEYSLESNDPTKVVYTEGTRELKISNLISDMDFNKTNLTGVNGLCDGSASSEGFYKREGYITLRNLCNEYVHNLHITGIVQARGIQTQPGGEVIEDITITEKYVADKGCDE